MEGLNHHVLEDIGMFFNKVNDRALYTMGINDSYDDGGNKALGETVEYFHPQITLDDRMRYIAENIVYNENIDDINKVCNTIISHFYGARGIHQTMTRNPDPKTALVDFHRLLTDEDYVEELNKNLDDAHNYGIPIYGSTELRTSLYGAANNFVAEKYNKPKDARLINIALWVAGFIERGIIKKFYEVNSLEELFNHLTTIEGVGSYYGYHCSTSNSVNPKININHDERFCVPGPGARYTLDLLFDKSCDMDYGERVVWFRENYKNYIGEIPLHHTTHNISVDGRKVFTDEQDELKTYGCEVGLCQYGVYTRLRDNPHLIDRRKVARLDMKAMEDFFAGKNPPNYIPKLGESGYQVSMFDIIDELI